MEFQHFYRVMSFKEHVALKVILVVVVRKGIQDLEDPQVMVFQVLRAYMVLKETWDFLDIQGYQGDLVHEVRDYLFKKFLAPLYCY